MPLERPQRRRSTWRAPSPRSAEHDPPAIVSAAHGALHRRPRRRRRPARRASRTRRRRAPPAPSCARLDPEVAGLIEPLLGTTFTPTVLDAGEAVNVIPTQPRRASTAASCPEMTHDDVKDHVARVLDPLGIELGVRVGRRHHAQRVAGADAAQREHRARAAPRRARRRARADDLGRLHRLALVPRGVPGLRRLRLRALRGRELPRHGAAATTSRTSASGRGRRLPGALLRAAGAGPARREPAPRRPPSMRDRFRGTLLGLAVGEALGAPAEFLTAEQVVENYGVLTEMVGGGVYDVAPGETTDATEMMLCLAESLADNGGFDPEDVMARYGAWFESQPHHVSLTVRAALISYRSGTHWDLASRRAFEILGGPTAGNGSLMRCAPVGLLLLRRRADAPRDVAPRVHAHPLRPARRLVVRGVQRPHQRRRSHGDLRERAAGHRRHPRRGGQARERRRCATRRWPSPRRSSAPPSCSTPCRRRSGPCCTPPTSSTPCASAVNMGNDATTVGAVDRRPRRRRLRRGRHPGALARRTDRPRRVTAVADRLADLAGVGH